VISSLPGLVETEVHRAENLKGAMNPEKSSENRSPRKERGIDPFKTLLKFLWIHSFRNKGNVLHVI
jgi:hypothetical protein